jgi:putative transcriptional regulator
MSTGAQRIHNRLAVLRVERGMSRVQLAQAVGVNYQTIGYLERGDYSPSLDLALRLSEVFGLPIEAMFSTRPFSPLSEKVYGAHSQEEVSR